MVDVEVVDMGDTVYCDYCNKDYTNSDAKGGLLFGSYAVCPLCVPETEASAKRFGEEHFIRARCPEDKSFAQWVREDLRG